MAVLMTPPKMQFFQGSTPLAGGKVYFYEAGTTTPKDTYTSQSGAVANTNPVILDSEGKASIWLSGSYKVVVKTSADVTVDTEDNITAFATNTSGTFTDTDFIITDGTDTSKGFKVEVSSVSASTTRTWTVPDVSSTFVGTTATQTLTNKTLTSPTITTPTLTVLDNAFTVQDNSDTSKQFQIQLSGLTASTTRTMTVPDADFTAVGTATTQTLTNKTLTSPVISGGTIDNATIGGTTAAAANVTTIKRASVTIADDAATSFTVGGNNGFFRIVTEDGNGNNFAMAYFRCSATGAIMTTAGTVGSAYNLTTGALTGTTGTDVRVNISAHTDGKIYIENRSGGSLTFRYHVECA